MNLGAVNWKTDTSWIWLLLYDFIYIWFAYQISLSEFKNIDYYLIAIHVALRKIKIFFKFNQYQQLTFCSTWSSCSCRSLTSSRTSCTCSFKRPARFPISCTRTASTPYLPAATPYSSSFPSTFGASSCTCPHSWPLSLWSPWKPESLLRSTSCWYASKGPSRPTPTQTLRPKLSSPRLWPSVVRRCPQKTLPWDLNYYWLIPLVIFNNYSLILSL